MREIKAGDSVIVENVYVIYILLTPSTIKSVFKNAGVLFAIDAFQKALMSCECIVDTFSVQSTNQSNF